jgi:hypothetical protein
VCRLTRTIHRTLDRLIFVEFIPELSTLLLASSASDRVSVYRLNRYACGRYRFEAEATIPSISCRIPIKGVSVCRVPTEYEPPSALSLQQTLERTQTKTFENVDDAIPPLAPPSPTSSAAVLQRQLERFRVYILFADETVAAFELTHPPPRLD